MPDKISFPLLSASNWWSIRKKFKQTIPGTVTPNYLASVLNMQERSATNNIIPYLVQIGIIDKDGNTSERAKMWRDDVDYPKVCEEIRKEIYPKELLDIPVDSNEDKEIVKRWFSRYTGTGESAVKKIASFYFLLCETNPSKEPDVIKPIIQKAENPFRSKMAPTKTTDIKTINNSSSTPKPHKEETKRETAPVPSININLQIHISSDASPEQIDRIFESMYKHIYSKKDDLNG